MFIIIISVFVVTVIITAVINHQCVSTCLSPMFVCGTGKRENEHFLLHCPLYSKKRQDLFDQLPGIDGFNVADVKMKDLCHLILFGDRNLGTVANRII